MKQYLIAICLVVLLVMVILVMSFGLGWFNAPLKTFSANNVEMLSRQANERWQALQAQKASIQAQDERLSEFTTLYGEDTGTWPQGKRSEYQQLSASLRNLVTAYNASCGEYNALWNDEWRSLPAPKDLPTSCELRN